MSATPPVYESYYELAKSVTPQWRWEEGVGQEFKYVASLAEVEHAFRVVDISSIGNIHDSCVKLIGQEVYGDKEEYRTRLEAERRSLRAEARDIKTRLVIFSHPQSSYQFNRFVGDLYGVEFRIEPAFFRACTSAHEAGNRPTLFLQEEPPSFIDFGNGWCAKFIDHGCDHPLTKKGVEISKSNSSLQRYLKC
jgi:hypothetical protein